MGTVYLARDGPLARRIMLVTNWPVLTRRRKSSDEDHIRTANSKQQTANSKQQTANSNWNWNWNCITQRRRDAETQSHSGTDMRWAHHALASIPLPEDPGGASSSSCVSKTISAMTQSKIATRTSVSLRLCVKQFLLPLPLPLRAVAGCRLRSRFDLLVAPPPSPSAGTIHSHSTTNLSPLSARKSPGSKNAPDSLSSRGRSSARPDSPPSPLRRSPLKSA